MFVEKFVAQKLKFHYEFCNNSKIQRHPSCYGNDLSMLLTSHQVISLTYNNKNCLLPQ